MGARIKERSRGCETGITLEYLEKLYAGYNAFLKDIAKVIPVIKVKYNKFRTGEEIAKVVVEEWRRLQSISVVDFVDMDKAKVSKQEADGPSHESLVESPSKQLKAED